MEKASAAVDKFNNIFGSENSSIEEVESDAEALSDELGSLSAHTFMSNINDKYTQAGKDINSAAGEL